MSRKTESIMAVVFAVAVLAGIQAIVSGRHSQQLTAASLKADAQVVQNAVEHTTDAPDDLTTPLTQYNPLDYTGPTLQMPVDAQHMLNSGAYLEARARLMTDAHAAVSDDDPHALATALTLLGMAALAEPDLDAAELYFMEALDVFQSRQDSAGAARVLMQIGHLHVISRERVRRAAKAYDALLVARWQISHGHYYQAQAQLQDIIDSNIALQRYGAAASASETQIKAWRAIGDDWQAEQTSLQAIRLYAASGQGFMAQRLIENLRAHAESTGGARVDLQALKTDVRTLLSRFDDSVMQVERARDYRRLYNHYRVKGDTDRAWKFRVLASQSLAGASRRAMYHRQPDVLVALYGSNRSMQLANRSLRQAHRYFQSTGSTQGVQAVQDLQAKIY